MTVVQLLNLHSIEIRPIIELEHIEYALQGFVEKLPLYSTLLVLLNLLFAHICLVRRHGTHFLIAGLDSFQFLINDQT